jgi:hypothetical protein
LERSSRQLDAASTTKTSGVNSHSRTDKSGGTQTFEAQIDLLFDRCVEEAVGGEPAQVVAACDLLLDLLRKIDRFETDDIVFFADEGGTWQFNINWKRVLRPYITCLTKVTERDEFERRSDAVDRGVRSSMAVGRGSRWVADGNP